jgi:hypothetical protein
MNVGRLLAPEDFPYSEGNDIVIVPNKNAYLSRKWPNASAIPYVLDSTFSNASHLIYF